jgi:hypothetical protein
MQVHYVDTSESALSALSAAFAACDDRHAASLRRAGRDAGGKGSRRRLACGESGRIADTARPCTTTGRIAPWAAAFIRGSWPWVTVTARTASTARHSTERSRRANPQDADRASRPRSSPVQLDSAGLRVLRNTWQRASQARLVSPHAVLASRSGQLGLTTAWG